MIDVHMLYLPTDREDWMRQALEALPEWVNLIMVPAQVGPIGPQRLAAFRRGSQPYVSCIDPDDWTEPDTFDRLLAAIQERDCQGVCCRELVHDLDNNATYMFPGKHKTFVLKREFVEEREALYRFDVNDKDIVGVPEVQWVNFLGHHWRKYNSAGKQQRRIKQSYWLTAGSHRQVSTGTQPEGDPRA